MMLRKLPQQEGEKVVEEMSTLDALECLGLCPANFEWFELNAAPPNASGGLLPGGMSILLFKKLGYQVFRRCSDGCFFFFLWKV